MSSFFFTDPQYIGVDLRSGSLRVATIRKKNKKWEILSLKELPLEEGVKINGTIVSSLNSRDVLVRSCSIPLKKPKDVFAALEFHVEPLLPYSAENAVIQGEIIETNKNSTTLTIAATRKNQLAAHLDTLKAVQIEPEIVTDTAHALAAFSTLLPQINAPLLLVHEGENEISTVLVEKGHVIASRSIDKSLNIEAEIQKTLLSFSSTHQSKKIEQIYFLGEDKELQAALLEASEQEVLPPLSPFCPFSQYELARFSLAIGAALCQNRKQSRVNFRQKEFVYPHQFKRIKKPLIGFFALSALLVGSLFGFGQVALTQKQQAVENAYFSFLKAQKIPLNELPETPVEYMRALNILEKKVKALPDTFPLLPQVPKVREVMGWLASLPEVQGNEGSLINIESIHYQLVKRPDFSHKKERYKVRVDLEFTANNAHTAHTFQEALKSDTTIVDSKQEVQWTPSKGKYKTTFYLKDQTRYG